MARAQGPLGIGPVRKFSELKTSMQEAIKAVQNGAVCVVDVRVVPGYDSNMSGSAAAKR